MRLRLSVVCALTLSLAYNAAGWAQVRDFQLLKESNPLLGSSNAAGLATLEKGSFSTASSSFSKDNGALISLEESPDSWKSTTGAESYVRISPKLAFNASLSYSHFRGRNMGAHVLMNPLENPINFLEEDLSTAGVKKKETYSLSGAFAWSFNSELSAGLKFDYKAADLTKYKDPRFMNVLVDLSFSSGLLFRLSENISLGANFIWRHSQEELRSGLYGAETKTRYVLVDEGAFYGASEILEGDIYHISLLFSRPLMQNRFGGAVQFATGRFYSLFTGLWRKGHFGNRKSSSVVFCEFGGPELEYQGILQIPSNDALHKVEFDAAYKKLINRTNSYTYKVIPGMSTEIKYVGQNETLSGDDVNAGLEWSFKKGLEGYRPDWSFRVFTDAFMRFRTVTFYPKYRKHNFTKLAIHLDAERSIKRSGNVYSFALGFRLGKGFGLAKEDGAYGPGSSKMKSFDDWLNRQFEYNTAGRSGSSFAFTYTRILSKSLAVYACFSDSFISLWTKPEYLDGRIRNLATLKIGCNF